MLIDRAVKLPCAATLHRLAVPFIFSNLGNQPMLPEPLAGSTGIKATICIEKSTLLVAFVAFHIRNQILEWLLHLMTVMVMASHDSRRANDRPIAVRYRQDSAGFGLRASLIGDGFAPFFAALWLPSRLSSEKCNSPVMGRILASQRRCRLPSLLHFRK